MSSGLGPPAEAHQPMSSDRERGSAPAEFAMVSALVIVLFLAAFQLGFALHVRNTLIAHAGEGARYGARADSSPAQGAQRTREMIRTSISGRFAQDVRAVRTSQDGTAIVRVTVVAPMPVVGPFGPGKRITVSGRAYAESQ